MVPDILALLHLFEASVTDRETHGWVTALAGDETRWPEAHELFDRVRRRNLKAIDRGDVLRESQYCFEEACLKSLFNETATDTPFDSDSPYWIIKSAVAFARHCGVPDQSVVNAIMSD